ncbi:MAG TPA: FHA domain-containing protein [Candidatus Limnocylindrales bacterium]|nr:FHA domain-containing protein [Candidatus Limnocylindrales bacterium]
MRLSTQLVSARQSFALNLGERVTVGKLARYLSQQEAGIDMSTLEFARVVGGSQHVQDIDLQAGDRLVIFTSPSQPGELTQPLNPGDKVAKFLVGDVVITSRGKKSLQVGKPDSQRDVDIDLRNLVSPRAIGFISRDTMRLDFDDRAKTWYASRTGKTRVLINEFELGTERVPLSDVTTLRLYRAGDEPTSPAFQPLAVIRIEMETVQNREDIIYLDQGPVRTPIQIGMGKERLTLNVSENVPLGQVAGSLLAFHKLNPTTEAQIVLMRLIPPATPLSAISFGQDETLYATRSQSFALNTLMLRDIHQREREYSLAAGPEDDVKLIGRRPEAAIEDPELDVDLFEAVIPRDNNPNAFKSLSRRQLKVFYKAAENSWWVQLEERASVPVFVNNTRTSAIAPVQLTSGDVLSFGPTLETYYARLEVEITAKAE